MLGPDIEQTIYLDYPVKTSTWFGKDFSLLELSVNTEKEPEFFFLILAGTNTLLFEYKENHLIKIASQTIEPAGENENDARKLIMKTASLLKLLPDRMTKPVFVSSDMTQAETLLHKISLPGNHVNKLLFNECYDEEKVKTMANTISKDWKGWYNKYISDLLLFAQKTNGLIPGFESVLKSLNKGTDGILLVDKKLKMQMQDNKAGNINFSRYETLKQQVEKFLARGNFVEMINCNLLKQIGGIALITANRHGLNEDNFLPRHSGIDFSIY